MKDTLLVVILVYGGLWIFTAVSYAIFITYRILNKYNDFGDTSCSLYSYSERDISYDREIDNAPPNEKNLLFTIYAEDPYTDKKRRIPEVLIKNLEKDLKNGN
jgi:hypothetical protein